MTTNNDNIRSSGKPNQANPHKRSATNRGSLLKTVNIFTMFTVVTLMITATLPVQASTTSQTGSVITFNADMDAQVNEANPGSNYGKSTYLQVDGDSGIRVQIYLNFSVSGLAGIVSNAKVRVYDSTNGSNNGPILYGTETSWTETGITWSNRPSPTTAELGNAGIVDEGTWVEYDVTSQVIADGTYSFVMIADSNDGLTFSSRQGAQPPQLVITTDGGQTTEPTTTSQPPTSPTAGTTATSQPPASPTAMPTATSQPPTGPVVLVGAGDISSCGNNNDELTAQLLDNISGTVFTAGDNAYADGTFTQFKDCYDPTWGRHKSRTNPVPGNHEYNTLGASGYFEYFNNIPSYYAYDLGEWRVYALNSEISMTATSEQVQWLKADLAANPKQCVLAYWHKPRWSSGKHGSNSSVQELWKALYDSGAELIINGHDHSYERFTQMNRNGQAVSKGMREFVVGTGGAGLYAFGTILSTSQVRNSTTYGVLKLTLNPSSYSWQFVPVSGKTFTDSGSANCR